MLKLKNNLKKHQTQQNSPNSQTNQPKNKSASSNYSHTSSSKNINSTENSPQLSDNLSLLDQSGSPVESHESTGYQNHIDFESTNSNQSKKLILFISN